MAYDLTPVKKQVTTALTVVNELVIDVKSDYERAIEIGTRIKEVAKSITERKEEITKPLNEALKSARALFKPLEDTLEEAERELKSKMLVFRDKEHQAEEEAKRKAEEEAKKLQEQADNGEITRMEAAAKSMFARIDASMEAPEKTVKTEKGAKATEKFITEYVVVDKTLIPLEFMEPNMVAIKNSFKSGVLVPGVEERKKAIISF